ncbi:MAG: GTPase Era [Firmicutes bacterium]|nr:GTPase Era [Bacillota bacterium]
MTDFKSGFVALVGRPNVGKSTLLNSIIGQKITITSDKPQTTRNQLRGILNGPNYQIIWVDTPGLHRPLHQLGVKMVKTARNALAHADLILWILDAAAGFTSADGKIAQLLSGTKQQLFVAWNKIDLVAAGKELQLSQFDGEVKGVFRVSALSGAGIPELIEALVAELPFGPAYYPPEMVTDHPERFLVAEYIREQVLHFTEEEVPHSVAVRIEDYQERPNGMIYIAATIYVERDSQKGIIIGSKGGRLKEIGARARVEIEQLVGAPVYLNLWVKVRKDWRNSEKTLREFGYGGEDNE